MSGSRRARGLMPALAAMTAALVVAGGVALATRTEGPAEPPTAGEDRLALGAHMLQQREDEVLRRVEVAVENRGAQPVVVTSLRLTVPGFDSPGPIAKDSPVPAGQVVNLPVPYGRPRCPPGAATPEAGTPRVTLRVRVGAGRSSPVVLAPADPDGLLERVLRSECLARRLAREVSLAFGAWRVVGAGDAVRLLGTLDVRLRGSSLTWDVTQIAGSVIYDVAPAGRSREPLARVDASTPAASVPVVVTQARCDGHARAETKKPYVFYAWLAERGGPEQAAAITVSAEDRARLRAVCPL